MITNLKNVFEEKVKNQIYFLKSYSNSKQLLSFQRSNPRQSGHVRGANPALARGSLPQLQHLLPGSRLLDGAGGDEEG